MSTKAELLLYNSLTRKLEVFHAKEAGKVGMYVCGITAYDYSHLGHARAAVAFDILFRYLKHLNYDVTYVRNFTDVDDKIIGRANEIGQDPVLLSRRFCDEYLVDMDSLQCERPTYEPRVTEHMEQIKDLITKIINNGFAYVVEGDVFYAVEKFPSYGQLSGQKLENMRAGERIAVDTRKRHPADFALWKAAKPGEPSWESPWGPGRPGWHIECSAMSEKYLTFNFDIHGGGLDLIFPHHENEIAQSCAASPESSVSYWMHNGHVTNNNEKMSKSLGNFFTIRQITERYHPLALRHFLISAHYRSALNYSVFQLEKASEAVFYIYQTLLDCQNSVWQLKEALENLKVQNSKIVGVAADARKCIAKLREEFENRMSDDLDAPNFLTGAFNEALRFINSSLVTAKKKLQKQQQSLLLLALSELEAEVRLVMDPLGLLAKVSYDEVIQQLKEKALIRAGLAENDVGSQIEERAVARKNKDFQKSDQIRADLEVKGIALMDVGDGTIWRPRIPVEQKEEAPAPQPPTARDQTPPAVPTKAERKEAAPVVENERSTTAIG